MGCLAFAIGAAGVIVLFLPPALGRLLDRTIEDWFAERHAGRLELGDAWLGSIYGEQRVERLILRDPDGDEVLRGALRAPSLEQLFDGPPHRFGPVVLRIELLRLVGTGEGSSNLERALAELPRAEVPVRRSKGPTTDVPFEVALEVVIDRLRYENSGGREGVLENLVFRGRLQWGPEATHLLLEGGSGAGVEEPLQARIELERSEFGPRRPWSVAVVLNGVPTALVRASCAAARPLAAFVGPRLDELVWSRQGQQVLLRCADGATRFDLTAEEHEGTLRSGEEGRLAATLACSEVAGRAVLAALLPLVTSPVCEDPLGFHQLRSAEFVWPLDGVSLPSGSFEFEPAPIRWIPAPVVGLFLGEWGERGTPTLESPCRYVLDDAPGRDAPGLGTLRYLEQRWALEDGWFQIDGELTLASGARTLTLSGVRGGEPLESVRLAGSGGALRPVPDEVPPHELPSASPSMPPAHPPAAPTPGPDHPVPDLPDADGR